MTLTLTTKSVPADIQLDLKMYGRFLAFLRRHPTHACRAMFGIVVPPHESAMLETCWQGYRENIVKCSRGTSKTFVVGSLFPVLKGLLFASTGILVASASKFRGGKLVIKDSARLIQGRLKNQRIPNKWGMASLYHQQAIKKDPDLWSMDFKSNSQIFTIPTNNEESPRGIRANIVIIDERANFELEMLQKVYIPFMTVGTDFEKPAEGSEGNQVFYVGTVDYSYRDWYKQTLMVKDLLKLQYEVQKAQMEGDWETYDTLKLEHGKTISGLSVSYLRYDYTDLLIPTTIDSYKINYPGAILKETVRWDERDGKDYIYTYPLSKSHIEAPLDQGLVDRDIWEAEHRNIFVQASGNVFPVPLVEKATGAIFSRIEERNRGWDSDKQGERYTSPILYECSDPCVLGVDVARVSDFSAFVVIRLGEADAEMFTQKDYSVANGMGPTSWNNVIWVEQHQKMRDQEIGDLIRELRRRYNIIYMPNIPGVAMDARGGGVNVRDELSNPTPAITDSGRILPNWTMPQRIYDPDDKEFAPKLMGTEAWAGLRLLFTDEKLNNELIGFSKAQMETGRLYIAPYKTTHLRHDPDGKLTLGYLGVQALKHQLLRIQAIVNPSGDKVKFQMPGDKTKVENKKDSLMAFLYACYCVRAYQSNAIKGIKNMPPTYGEIVSFGNSFLR